MSPTLYMDAEITPNRSLSQRGFIVLIGVITTLNCISAAVFIAMGAHWVPVFLGLDLAAVIVAFLASFRAARQVERVRVSAGHVRVTHEIREQVRLVWESPTAFTRIALETEDDRAVELRLALSGREVAVAQALSPSERAQFAVALEQAIRKARMERG
ncbi:MAG: DUF2244 domain-containing protein [Phenylobacterium sp.]|uniref:DUF2244 domain-containing protein n=1 Tax=Phenylobacterium sp. TaxID=1871053 RepID=UPI00391B7127